MNVIAARFTRSTFLTFSLARRLTLSHLLSDKELCICIVDTFRSHHAIPVNKSWPRSGALTYLSTID